MRDQFVCAEGEVLFLKRSSRYCALVLALALLTLFTLGENLGFAVEASTGQTSIQSVIPFPLEELRPGMKGIGKTVAKGTTIEEFHVEVLGVLQGEQNVSQLVLVQVSGDVIDRMGGIASGMSGSPVYVDGKLLGAISYTFSFTDRRLGLVTPIGPMLEILKYDRTETALQLPSGRWTWADAEARLVAGYPIEEIYIAWESDAGDTVTYDNGRLCVTPASAPLLVGGMGPRARKELAASFKPFGVETVAVPGALAGINVEDVDLEPGAALAVQLVTGDVQVTSLGTVTYVDGSRFVGFGHPFLNRGSVNLMASTAYIYTTVNSLSMPFKLGAPMKTVGTITQDRGAGVGGYIGRPPETIDLIVKVTDRNLGTTKELQAEIANEPGLLLSLVSSAALQGLDQGIDRIGPGTSRLVFKIAGEGFPGPIVRDNMFYSPLDISAVSLAELLETLQILVNNEFQEVKVKTLEVTAQVEQERRTAVIEKATPTVAQARAGEMVDVEVVIRPYRGQRETKILRLPIPDTAQPGAIHVTVRGGGLGYPYLDLAPFHEDSKEQEDAIDLEPVGPPSSADSFEKLLETILKREKNNEIVMEYIPYYDAYVLPSAEESGPPSEGEAEETESASTDEDSGRIESARIGGSVGWNQDETEPVRVTLPTRYVIEGQTTFEIAISDSGETEESADSEGELEEEMEASRIRQGLIPVE
ncbi:MAG TPA: hypothetical protein GXX47_04830 [Firmicutes bacterium]|nr:hypothetical protein [Bacillota bacterium]